MRCTLIRNAAWLLLVLCLVSACSDGGGTGGTGLPISPSSTSVASFGQITSFGSITVGTSRYETPDDTIITNNDDLVQPENIQSLGLGNVCTVDGTQNPTTGVRTATMVTCASNIAGPITAINVSAGTLVVMGQRVRVDATTATVFDDFIALADLVVGDVVQVSGFLDLASGEIQATRIERKLGGFVPDTTLVQIKGTISTFNGNDQFVVAGLTVLLTNTTEVQVAGGIAEGKFVEVKGTLNAAGDTLTATKVEDEDNNPLAGVGAEVEGEVEGLISGFVSVNNFRVNGIPVNAQNATFEGGSASDLTNRLKVEAEGSFDATGTLVADKVQIKRSSNVRIEANVIGAVSANSLEVGGPGAPPEWMITVDISAAEIDDNTAISTGERVKIRGFWDPTTNVVTATRLQREGQQNATDDVKLRGPVDNADNPVVTIVGVPIDTDGLVDFEDFEDVDETTVSQTQFFDRLAADPTLEVEAVDDDRLDGPDGIFDMVKLEN